MTKICKECGKGLSFFSFSSLCPECKAKIKARKIEEKETEKKFKEEKGIIEEAIINAKSISDQHLDVLKIIKKKYSVELYKNLYEEFIKDAELEEREIEVLQKIQNASNLSNEEILYVDKVLPYIYVNLVKKEGRLPTMDVQITDTSPIILKKNEIVHYANNAKLKEMRTISLGYQGGSRGVSFRIMKGVTYRVGAHRGHIVKEDRYVETSRGALIITNQRVYLHPAPGCKPISIPLNKILSYNCFRDCIEVYKEGREKGYAFFMKSGAVEISGLCLNFLLNK
jgi:hypothetical protein